jgi:TPP-dependent pyruvate/acetoin dehydrogenase alpha subunit
VLTDELADEIRGEALEVMRVGIAAAEAEPEADPDLLFKNAYVDPPPSLTDG